MASRAGRFSEALAEASSWLDDQPFSGRPAAFGSHLAGVLDEHVQAVRFANQGILCNSEDFTLYNNLAFSLINLNRVDDAGKILERISTWKVKEREFIVLSATTGLHRFRSGLPVQGRDFYLQAIEFARKTKQDKHANLALIYLLTFRTSF